MKEKIIQAKITLARVVALLYKAKRTQDWKLVDEALELLGNT